MLFLIYDLQVYHNSKAVKINNISNFDQSIKIDTGLLYIIKIKFKRDAKIFEGDMTSFWLTSGHAIGQNFISSNDDEFYSSLERFYSGYVSYINHVSKTNSSPIKSN